MTVHKKRTKCQYYVLLCFCIAFRTVLRLIIIHLSFDDNEVNISLVCVEGYKAIFLRELCGVISCISGATIL